MGYDTGYRRIKELLIGGCSNHEGTLKAHILNSSIQELGCRDIKILLPGEHLSEKGH